MKLDWLEDFVESDRQRWHYQTEQFIDPTNATQLTNSKLVVGMAKCDGIENVNKANWYIINYLIINNNEYINDFYDFFIISSVNVLMLLLLLKDCGYDVACS